MRINQGAVALRRHYETCDMCSKAHANHLPVRKLCRVGFGLFVQAKATRQRRRKPVADVAPKGECGGKR